MRRTAIGLTATVLLVASLVSLVVEAGPFLGHALGTAAPGNNFSTGVSDMASRYFPESRVARRRRLESCLEALDAARVRDAAGAGERDLLMRTCLAIAETSAAERPLSGNDWLIAGSLASRLGDAARAQRYLLASFRTTPNEEWIAVRRAPVAFAMRAQLDPAVKQAMDADFRMLFQSRKGIRALATFYVESQAMRDYLTETGSSMDPAVQRDFLRLVRAAAAR